MAASSTAAGPVRPVTGDAPSLLRLAVAWQHPGSRSIQPVGLLTYDRNHYSFQYVANAKNAAGFVPFVGFPDPYRIYQSSRLFPLFAQRVMDPRRPDFTRYIRTLDLSEEATPWEQLIRSEGRRAGDTIIVIPEPIVGPGTETCSQFLVHGIRYAIRENPEVDQRLNRLVPDDPLALVAEPSNEKNFRAIKTADIDMLPLGWVPDLLLDYVHAVCNTGPPRLTVQHVNGSDAPAHLRLLVRLSGNVPTGYKPFAGPGWEPFG